MQAQIKEIGEFPAQRASNAEMFPFDDVIMQQEFSSMPSVWLVAVLPTKEMPVFVNLDIEIS